MIAISPDEKGWYSLKADITPEVVRALHDVGHIEKLSITNVSLVTVRHVRLLKALQSLGQLWLWCDITRRAMRHLIELPGLATLDVLCIRGPGSLGHFDRARTLEIFRANHYLSEADVIQIAKCKSIKTLGIQSAPLTKASFAAILALPCLENLDIEATRFDDKMARALSQSRTIRSLDIGGTKITRRGLEHIVSMKGLQSLDLWETALNEDELELLSGLPNLEYLSIGNIEGNTEGCPALNIERILPLLLSLPGLKRIWLDGIKCEPEHQRVLEAKFGSVRINHA